MPKSVAPSAINLTERIEQLSSKRQEIIRPILEHPREYVLLSIRALATRLKTDPATIVRNVQGLGFENYRQFQRNLHELSLAFATSLDTMQQSKHDGGSGQPAADAVLRDLKNLQGLKNSLDPQRFTRLAKRIYSAPRCRSPPRSQEPPGSKNPPRPPALPAVAQAHLFPPPHRHSRRRPCRRH